VSRNDRKNAKRSGLLLLWKVVFLVEDEMAMRRPSSDGNHTLSYCSGPANPPPTAI
jgi:hypothetical protein